MPEDFTEMRSLVLKISIKIFTAILTIPTKERKNRKNRETTKNTENVENTGTTKSSISFSNEY